MALVGCYRSEVLFTHLLCIKQERKKENQIEQYEKRAREELPEPEEREKEIACR